MFAYLGTVFHASSSQSTNQVEIAWDKISNIKEATYFHLISKFPFMVVYFLVTSGLYLKQPIDSNEQNILSSLSEVFSFCTTEELYLSFQYVLKFSWAKNDQDQHWDFKEITESLPAAASNIKNCYPCLNSVDEHDSAVSLRLVQSFSSCLCGVTYCLPALFMDGLFGLTLERRDLHE